MQTLLYLIFTSFTSRLFPMEFIFITSFHNLLLLYLRFYQCLSIQLHRFCPIYFLSDFPNYQQPGQFIFVLYAASRFRGDPRCISQGNLSTSKANIILRCMKTTNSMLSYNYLLYNCIHICHKIIFKHSRRYNGSIIDL